MFSLFFKFALVLDGPWIGRYEAVFPYSLTWRIKTKRSVIGIRTRANSDQETCFNWKSSVEEHQFNVNSMHNNFQL